MGLVVRNKGILGFWDKPAACCLLTSLRGRGRRGGGCWPPPPVTNTCCTLHPSLHPAHCGVPQVLLLHALREVEGVGCGACGTGRGCLGGGAGGKATKLPNSQSTANRQDESNTPSANGCNFASGQSTCGGLLRRLRGR